MSVRIVTAVKQLPPYSRSTSEILPMAAKWMKGQDARFARKASKIFEGAMVDRRYSIMEPLEVFTPRTFEEKNDIYAKKAIELGEQVLRKALAAADWVPSDIDYLITVSCTGIMIPSLDAFLINRLCLRSDVVRLPVTEMGCAAGISGIIYAKNFLKANPGRRAAVVAVESPTATFQLEDFSMPNIVSAAIFGDGAACCLLSSKSGDEGPEIRDEQMYHFYDAEHMMGFKLTNSGLKMILDAAVPETIQAHFHKIIEPFLARNKCGARTVDHLIFHPGGKKIINTVEALFAHAGKNIDATKAVLKNFGNMSSATVIYVLEAIMDQKPSAGETGLMLSFGPGFSAQTVLLQW